MLQLFLIKVTSYLLFVFKSPYLFQLLKSFLANINFTVFWHFRTSWNYMLISRSLKFNVLSLLVLRLDIKIDESFVFGWIYHAVTYENLAFFFIFYELLRPTVPGRHRSWFLLFYVVLFVLKLVSQLKLHEHVLLYLIAFCRLWLYLILNNFGVILVLVVLLPYLEMLNNWLL